VQGNRKLTWIVLAVLVVAGFFGYRIWKKKKKHN